MMMIPHVSLCVSSFHLFSFFSFFLAPCFSFGSLTNRRDGPTAISSPPPAPWSKKTTQEIAKTAITQRNERISPTLLLFFFDHLVFFFPAPLF